MTLANPPERVRNLDGLDVQVRCPHCGRVAPIDVARLRINQGMRLPEFLAKLQCNETRDHRRCGGKPDRLEVRYRPAGDPDAPIRLFVMDLAGEWTEAEP